MLALLPAMGLSPPDTWADHQQKHILVMHSYHKGLTWTDSITEGIESVFNDPNVPVEIEYAFMDTKRVFNQAYIDQLVELYRVKYRKRSFNAIISSDDHAFRFLLNNHDHLFGDVPIIFCGVNYFKDEILSNQPNFTGVLESFDMLTTINTALDFQPEAKRLIAVGDQTISGKANKERLKEIIPSLKRPMEITILDNHTMAEIQSYVGQLSPQDIVVWLVVTADRNGEIFSFEKSTKLISSHSTAPMYSFWDFNIGHGIVGGMLTSGFLQGEQAAGIALRIIQGEPISRIPVIKKSPNQYMFDYIQLKRFDLKLSQLPSESLIVNRPQTFYSQNKKLVWSMLVIFSTMSAIIVALLFAIASRKKAERASRASRDRYQNVFDSTSAALFEVDFSAVSKDIDHQPAEHRTDFRKYIDHHVQISQQLACKLIFKDVNPAAVRLFKAQSKNTLIEALPQIVKEQSSALKEILIAMAEKHDHLAIEDSFQNFADESLHVILSLNFPKDPKNYRNMVVSVFDITDRKMSEQALRRSEDRFRTVFNQAASGMALIDLDDNYLRVNSALCQMIGYEEREFLKLTWHDITHEEDMAISLENKKKVLSGKITRPIEKRYRHKNGKVVHVLFNLAAIFDASQNPLYLIAQFQDISQIKAAQEALKEREERYRQYFEGNLSGVYIATPDGEVKMCNDVFAAILGFTSSNEVIGTRIDKYYQNPDQGRQLVAQIMQDKRIEQHELVFICKDGSPVQCLVNAIGRYNEQGNLIEIQGYLMDITRMKSLEAQLLHAQKMESIGTMAGGVAHDFNNLLMGIMGNTSLLLVEKEKNQPEYKRLKSIEQLIQSGSDLTRQLLGFAKGGKYEVRTTDLNQLIIRSIKMFARTHKEIQVETELCEELKLVEADRTQIDQVLYNLYLNAWQAMENGGGRLFVQTRNTPLDNQAAAPYGLAAGEYVEILVHDNGIGMDPTIQQRIFDPFFTTKERERGTGLGLASAYGIIKNHAGSITVKSKPMHGSCFTVMLPVSKKKEVEHSVVAPGRLVKGTETILLVDDEEGVLDAVGSMLKHLGYTVRTAVDGQTAIAKYQANHTHIDLVILDMVMPGMGGKEAFESFKKIDPNVKVLLSSGYTADGQAAGIIKSGCLGFIQKPFSIHQLSQKLGEVFHR